MSWRRRRSIFDIFDEMFQEFEELMKSIEEEFEELVRSGRAEIRGPYVYGFSITIGPDGKPIIQEFGNVRRLAGKPKISEEREPLVDVLEDDDYVTIVAELPGVDKEKIKIRATEDKVIIRASNAERKYYKEVELPVKVKPETAKATYRNGVLEIKLEKKEKKPKKEEEEGVEVKVE